MSEDKTEPTTAEVRRLLADPNPDQPAICKIVDEIEDELRRDPRFAHLIRNSLGNDLLR